MPDAIERVTEDTLYQCPVCGHQEKLDHRDWQEHLPACPVTAGDEFAGTEDDLIKLCPDTDMVPIWGPGAQSAAERANRDRAEQVRRKRVRAEHHERDRQLFRDAAHVVAREGFFSTVSGQEEFWANVEAAFGEETAAELRKGSSGT